VVRIDECEVCQYLCCGKLILGYWFQLLNSTHCLSAAYQHLSINTVHRLLLFMSASCTNRLPWHALASLEAAHLRARRYSTRSPLLSINSLLFLPGFSLHLFLLIDLFLIRHIVLIRDVVCPTVPEMLITNRSTRAYSPRNSHLEL